MPARDLVAKQGADPVYGARPLRRAIQTLIEDPLSEELLQGGWSAGDIVQVDSDGREAHVHQDAGPHPGAAPPRDHGHPQRHAARPGRAVRGPGGSAGGLMSAGE